MSRVVRPAGVRKDVKEIGRYVGQRSQSLDLALRFLDRIDEKCNLYAAHPQIGTRRADLGPEVRCFPVGDFVVFYEPHQNGVRLLVVVHGSRDIPSDFRDRFGKPNS
ncbi:MAG: type II toxin-antitoxin system RelE/ParE family toxin [Pirellulaceae bacterium]|nr:type II toxin-antitoxin system RelE/ParE family toxin [Pirellulaceae bacterium]